jgi:hypothetical protein
MQNEGTCKNLRANIQSDKLLMDFSVLIIIVIIIIVVGYILSRPFVRSGAASGTPHERNKPADPSANTVSKNELLEPTTVTDERPEDDTLPDE